MIQDEVARYLAARVPPLVDYRPDDIGGDCFIDRLPDEPHKAVMIRGTGGPQADMKFAYDNPTFQVWVRDPAGRLPAYDRARGLYNALHGLWSVELTPGGTWVVSCRGIQSEPVPMGQDANGREEFSLNFQMEVRVTSSLRE